MDGEALAGKLRRKIRGEVRFRDGDRALYATDSSNYRQTPIGVVIPRDPDDVLQTLEVCREFGAPITSRGAATSLAGQTCNVSVIMDFSKYVNRILELDPARKMARIEPGLVLDELRHAAVKHQLTFGPDPSTHRYCTLGGMMGNNSCGVHSALGQFLGPGSRTVDFVQELNVVTYDGLQLHVGPTSPEELEQIIKAGGRRGEIYSKLKSIRDRYGELVRQRFPNIPRRVSGYALEQLLPENNFNVARALVGSEGTCVSILESKVHLMHSPPIRYLVVLGFPDIYIAGDHVPEVAKHQPTGLEGIDDVLIDDMRHHNLHVDNIPMLPDGKGWLLVEIGGDSKDEAEERAEKLIADLKSRPHRPSIKLLREKEEQEKIWQIRESSLGATAHLGGDNDAWEGWEDSSVPPEQLGAYLRDFRKLLNKFGYACTLYGHFAGGCVHTRIDFGLKNADGIRKYHEFTVEAAHLVVSHGGSLSGEHGDGQSRAELLPIMYGDELVRGFAEFKAIWDPTNKMNPHKIVDAYHNTENLRYGSDYNPPQPETYFRFAEDGGSFSYALERCVGVGLCRRHENGTMCPSYMVTHEEQHATRGRARLLWEMMNGDVMKEGWRSDAVRESLDLCLACKGCKADCPVHVDMATYKAEFLSHYYKRRLRPRHAYSMGLIYWWAKPASLMPGVVNWFGRTVPFSSIMKWLGGIAPERKIPSFATETFKHWFNKRVPRNPSAPKVLLWPDTFTNHFHPEIGKAAVEVLEDAGFNPVIPQKSLCCGRPLYDFGMLKTAKRLLEQILEALRDELTAGTPIVGLEPSCVAVFRDEAPALFPNREDVRRLKHQTFTLSEFLRRKAPHYKVPILKRKALVHGHCHHKAVMKMFCEEAVLKEAGIDYHVLDSGCCGMAGSFGFEKDNYDVSIKCGERVLLPSVRHSDEETLIIADGFSCREQIAQQTERRALHTAQVLQMAVAERRKERHEEEYHEVEAKRLRRKPAEALAGAAASVVGAVIGAFSGIAAIFSKRKSPH